MLVMVVFFIAFRWIHLSTPLIRLFLLVLILLLMPTLNLDRKSGSAGMPRPISYAVFCLKKKKESNGTRDCAGIGVMYLPGTWQPERLYTNERSTPAHDLQE